MINKAIPAGERYAAFHESIRRDYRLTGLDFRVMIYLLSRTENWKASQANIASEVLSGERAVRTSLQHIQELGYGHMVMSSGKKQNYMIDFVLNYISPSIPTNRPPEAGSSGSTKPVHIKPQPAEECSQPAQQSLVTGSTEPDNRLNSACSTGSTEPTTEQEQNSRQNSIYKTGTEQDVPKLVDTDIPLYKQDTVEGAQAYCDMAAAILGNLGKRKHIGPATDKGLFRPARRES